MRVPNRKLLIDASDIQGTLSSALFSGFSGTRVFEDAGGNTHTVTFVNGLCQSWGVTGAGAAGAWQFNAASNSAHAMLTWD